jgi:hypothetical protein
MGKLWPLALPIKFLTGKRLFPNPPGGEKGLFHPSRLSDGIMTTRMSETAQTQISLSA